MAEFDIKELCDRAGVTPRTVHFYVQQGLLPPAGAPGPGARYGEGHADRIRLIRLLQRQHLPLAEIARRIRSLDDEQVKALLDETSRKRVDRRGSALDYIRSVLAEPELRAVTPRDLASSPMALMRSFSNAAAPASPAAPTRSQWERYTLTDGVELHVRRPLSRIDQKQFEKLMAAARGIFENKEGEGQA